ncbi:MAG: protease inhibitor I42 family protein [bacterium]|nr:protease inhibitor I42 family protein [bacterium]
MVSILPFAACTSPTGGSGDAEQDPADAAAAELTDADDGGTVALAVSARMTISLASNPTTGFEWGLAEFDEAVLEHTGQDYIEDDPPPGGWPEGWSGVGGTDVWEFTARAAGETTLRLEYRRDWEDEEVADDSFEVTVTVTAEE